MVADPAPGHKFKNNRVSGAFISHRGANPLGMVIAGLFEANLGSPVSLYIPPSG